MRISEREQAKLLMQFSAIIRDQAGEPPMVLAARLVSAISEGAGPALVDATEAAIDLQDPDLEEAWNRRRPAPKVEVITEHPEELPKPPRMIITKDDPEFAKAVNFDEAARRGVVTSGAKLGRASSPSGKLASVLKYWTPDALIREIESNTPTEIWFTPNGADKNVRVNAVRNIENMAGLDQVRLKYFNPGISGEGGVNEAGQIVIPLIAVHTFFVTDRTLDWEGAKQDVLTQLKCMFAGKTTGKGGGMRRNISETDPGPSILDEAQSGGFNFMRETGMRDDAVIRREKNWDSVSDPHSATLDDVISGNKALGNR